MCFSSRAFLGLSFLIIGIPCRGLAEPVCTVEKRGDEFTAETIVRTHRNLIPWGSHSAGVWAIDAICRLSANDEKLLLSLRWKGSEWAFLVEGQGVIFIADGERLPLTCTGSSSFRDIKKDGVEEFSYCETSRGDLSRIAGGREVKVRVAGSRLTQDTVLDDDNKGCFAEFLSLLPIQ